MIARSEHSASRLELSSVGRATPGTRSGDEPLLLHAASAVSWGAILAGAAAAAAMSLILLILGTGLGLSAVSPWVQTGISAESFTITSILWLGCASLIAAGTGGYLAGRLRTRWLAVDPDEVYFRDTAHGFLTWAVATLVTATVLTTVIAGIVGTAAQTTAAVAAGSMTAGVLASRTGIADPADSVDHQYLLDALFRRNASPAGLNEASGQSLAAAMAETGRIIVNALPLDSLPADDLRHGALLIASHTGLSEQAASQRLTNSHASIRTSLSDAETAALETADLAREAASYAALWLFVALLAGAFVASWSATFGGRQRDQS
jgi:hypothetical protein